MNYLCVCQGGCVRSVALAYCIKYKTAKNKRLRNNAWAVGMDHFPWNPDVPKVQKGALEFLSLVTHADKVLTVSSHVYDQAYRIVHTHQPDLCNKIIQLEIGEDRWGLRIGPYNDELLEICLNELKRVGIK